MIEHIYSSIQN